MPPQFLTCSKNDFHTSEEQISNEEPRENPSKNDAPLSFELTSIENNATDTEVLPTFSWSAATDIDGDAFNYDFYLDSAENPEFFYTESIAETTTVVSELLNLSTQ